MFCVAGDPEQAVVLVGVSPDHSRDDIADKVARLLSRTRVARTQRAARSMVATEVRSPVSVDIGRPGDRPHVWTQGRDRLLPLDVARPIAGDPIANPLGNGGWGTFGGMVEVSGYGYIGHCITNWHVAYGNTDDPLVHPPEAPMQEYFATNLWQVFDGNFDLSVARARSGSSWQNNMRDGFPGYPDKYSFKPIAPAVGMKTRKYGARTGRTEGTVQNVEVSVKVNYGTPDDPVHHWKHSQIEYDMHTLPGDSGSLVMNVVPTSYGVFMYWLGLHFAGGGGLGYGNTMTYFVDRPYPSYGISGLVGGSSGP